MALALLPPPHLLPEEIQGQCSGVPIDEAQLCFLLAAERVQVVRVVTRTLPKFRRGSPFKPRSIVRLCVRRGFIGCDYLSVVRKQRQREGMDLRGAWARVAPGPLWRGRGVPVAGNRHLVRHQPSGLLYLVLYPQTDYRGVPVESFRAYFTRDTRAPVERELVETWRARSHPSNFPRTKKKIPWRLPCLGSIVSITLGGTPYTLIGERSAPMSAEKTSKKVDRGVSFEKPKRTRAARKPKVEPADGIEAVGAPVASDELVEKIRAAKSTSEPIFGKLMRFTPPEMEYRCGRIDMRGDDAHKRLEAALNTPREPGWSAFSLMNWGTFAIITWQRAKEEPAAV